MEAPLNDLELVTRLREGHRSAVASSAAGNLSHVFSLPDDAPEAHVYVVKVLDVHPALGKVAGRRLMGTLGIDQFAHVSDLSADTRVALLLSCGEQP